MRRHAVAAPTTFRKSPHPLNAAFVRTWRNPLGFFGLAILGLLVLIALAAPLIAPYDPVVQHPGRELLAPGPDFLLGTDELGRDILARLFYGEPYLALPMRHALEHKEGRLFAEYQWRRGRRWETLAMTATGEPQSAGHGSHEEFITEHYWGYTARRSGCSEYRVEHPRWRLWKAATTKFDADVATLYGPQFVETLKAPPVSGFIADGSGIEVHQREG